ncbi:MAG: hypothetical protein HY560_07840, partial [Gemmatimonadetes bacterium]|nr:hypothetical protein [Gemmatimonadota bacterium]
MRIMRLCCTALLALGVTIAELPAQGIASLKVSPERVRLRVGERLSVAVTAYGADGAVVTPPTLGWSSTDTGVVRVESDVAAPDLARLVGVGEGVAVVEVRGGDARGFTVV